jgi:hypothetical protein
MSRSQVLEALKEARNGRHLIYVFGYRDGSRVGFSRGVITEVNEDVLVLHQRGQGDPIRIDLRRLRFAANGFGCNLHNNWRLSDSDGWSWDVVDVESSRYLFDEKHNSTSRRDK